MWNEVKCQHKPTMVIVPFANTCFMLYYMYISFLFYIFPLPVVIVFVTFAAAVAKLR